MENSSHLIFAIAQFYNYQHGFWLACSFCMTDSSLRKAMIRLQRGYFMATFKKQVLWPPTIKSTYYSTK